MNGWRRKTGFPTATARSEELRADSLWEPVCFYTEEEAVCWTLKMSGKR